MRSSILRSGDCLELFRDDVMNDQPRRMVGDEFLISQVQGSPGIFRGVSCSASRIAYRFGDIGQSP
jgi:hypothetical protein